MTLIEKIPSDRSKEFKYFPEIIERLLFLLPPYEEELSYPRDNMRYEPKNFKNKVLKTLDGHLMTHLDRHALATDIESQVAHFLTIYKFTPNSGPSTSFENPFYFGFKERDMEIIKIFILDNSYTYLQDLETNYKEDVIKLHNHLKEHISFE